MPEPTIAERIRQRGLENLPAWNNAAKRMFAVLTGRMSRNEGADRSSPGLGHTLQQIATDPLNAAEGATVNIAKAFGESLLDSSKRGSRGLAATWAAATGQYDRSKFYGPDDITGPAQDLLSGFSLGLTSGWTDRSNEYYKNELQASPNINPNLAAVKAFGKGTKDFITEDVLPIEDIGRLWRGEKQTGYDDKGVATYSPLTSEEVGETITSALLKMSLVKRPLAKVKGKIESRFLDSGKSQKAPGPMEDPSIGEIKKWIEQNKAVTGKASKTDTILESDVIYPIAESANTIRKQLTHDVAEKTFNQNILNSELMRQGGFAFLKTESAEKFLEMYIKDPDTAVPISQAVAQSIAAGEVVPPLVSKLVNNYNITIKDAQKLYAETYLYSASKSGGGIGPLGEAMKMAYFDNLLIKDDVKATPHQKLTAARFNRLIEQSGKVSAGYGGIGKTSSFIVELEKTRLSAMVSSLQNAMRNLDTQFLVGGFEVVANFATGLIESALNPDAPIKESFIDFNNSVRAIKEGIGRETGGPVMGAGEIVARKIDLLQDKVPYIRGEQYRWFSEFADFMARSNPRTRSTVVEYLNSFPGTKEKLLGGASFDAWNYSLKELILKFQDKGLIDTLKGMDQDTALKAAQAFYEINNSLNKVQESGLRRMFYDARYAANLERMGYTPKQIIELAKDPNANSLPELNAARAASADAVIHALKSTFAYTPNEGIPGAILGMYASAERAGVPLTMFANPFPRFWMNRWSYIYDHSPLNILDLFDPEFKKTFMDVYSNTPSGKLAHANAVRTVSRGITGTLMLAGASAMDEAGMIGPKPWLIRTDETDEQGNQKYADTRAWSPFNDFLVLNGLIKSAKNNTPFPLTNEELLDWVTSVRNNENMAGMPIVKAITDSFDPNKPLEENNKLITNLIQNSFSQYFTAFLTPIGENGIVQSLNVIATDAKPNQKINTSYDPFSPLINKINEVVPQAGPARIDPYTGQPVKIQNPELKSLMGIDIVSIPEIQSKMMKSNLNLYYMMGTLGTPKADEVYREEMGKLLTQYKDIILQIPEVEFEGMLKQFIGVAKNKALSAMDSEQRKSIIIKDSRAIPSSIKKIIPALPKGNK